MLQKRNIELAHLRPGLGDLGELTLEQYDRALPHHEVIRLSIAEARGVLEVQPLGRAEFPEDLPVCKEPAQVLAKLAFIGYPRRPAASQALRA